MAEAGNQQLYALLKTLNMGIQCAYAASWVAAAKVQA